MNTRIARTLRRKKTVEVLATSPIFGVPLEEAVRRHTDDVNAVPEIISCCIQYLKERDAHEADGIFRMSGASNRIKQLKETFDKYVFKENPIMKPFTESEDVHVVAGLLKLYLRELPELVITSDIAEPCIKILESCVFKFEDSAQLRNIDKNLVDQLVSLLCLLPSYNLALLLTIMEYLKIVISLSDVNRMSGYNISVVFSPTLNIDYKLLIWLITNADTVIEKCSFYTSTTYEEPATCQNENVAQESSDTESEGVVENYQKMVDESDDEILETKKVDEVLLAECLQTEERLHAAINTMHERVKEEKTRIKILQNILQEINNSKKMNLSTSNSKPSVTFEFDTEDMNENNKNNHNTDNSNFIMKENRDNTESTNGLEVTQSVFSRNLSNTNNYFNEDGDGDESTNLSSVTVFENYYKKYLMKSGISEQLVNDLVKADADMNDCHSNRHWYKSEYKKTNKENALLERKIRKVKTQLTRLKLANVMEQKS